jgi:adenylate kinase family enzyme
MEPRVSMSTARRISVVGSTGSGKTTLARDLSVRLGLIFYELDVLRGEYTGKSPAYSSFAEAVAELVQNEGWIIDGHYRDVRHLIWQRSDLVVHLNYSLMLIVARLVNRFIGKWRGGGSSGGGSASWTRRFARMAKTIRERREYAKIFNGPNFADLTVIELKSPHATREWLAGLETAPDAKADSEATTANAPS